MGDQFVSAAKHIQACFNDLKTEYQLGRNPEIEQKTVSKKRIVKSKTRFAFIPMFVALATTLLCLLPIHCNPKMMEFYLIAKSSTMG